MCQIMFLATTKIVEIFMETGRSSATADLDVFLEKIPIQRKKKLKRWQLFAESGGPKKGSVVNVSGSNFHKKFTTNLTYQNR